MTAGGIVLAGGRSRRMGAPKATLDWHGRPLVVHVARTLQAAVAGPVVVVGAAGQELPSLPPGIAVAEDAEPGRGPLQGLLAGLERLGDRADVAVTIATDQPLVQAALVHRLLGEMTATTDVVAFTAGGRLQPLGAAYRTALAPLVRARLAGDEADASLRGLLAAVRTRTIAATPAEAAQLRSLDTPEAYEEALRASAG